MTFEVLGSILLRKLVHDYLTAACNLSCIKYILGGHFMICTVHKICLGDQMKNDEMGGACDTYGRQVKCIHNFGRDI
jgi:hypothetical protein